MGTPVGCNGQKPNDIGVGLSQEVPLLLGWDHKIGRVQAISGSLTSGRAAGRLD